MNDGKTLKDFMSKQHRELLGNRPTTHENCTEVTRGGDEERKSRQTGGIETRQDSPGPGPEGPPKVNAADASSSSSARPGQPGRARPVGNEDAVTRTQRYEEIE